MRFKNHDRLKFWSQEWHTCSFLAWPKGDERALHHTENTPSDANVNSHGHDLWKLSGFERLWVYRMAQRPSEAFELRAWCHWFMSNSEPLHEQHNSDLASVVSASWCILPHAEWPLAWERPTHATQLATSFMVECSSLMPTDASFVNAVIYCAAMMTRGLSLVHVKYWTVLRNIRNFWGHCKSHASDVLSLCNDQEHHISELLDFLWSDLAMRFYWIYKMTKSINSFWTSELLTFWFSNFKPHIYSKLLWTQTGRGNLQQSEALITK